MDTNILIDLHSSPNCSEFVLIDYNERARYYVDLCKATNVPFGVRYSNGNTIKKFVQDRGGIAITLELDRMEKINYGSATSGIDIVKRLLNEIVNKDFYEAKPTGDPIYQYYCYKSGLVEYVAKPGDFIEEGQTIANILNVRDGKVLESIISKFSARVLLVGRDYASTADSIAVVQNESSWDNKKEEE